MTAQRNLLPLLFAAVLAGSAAPAHALGQSADFKVAVTLNVLENGRCVSETWSAKTQAQVQVVCSTGEFVDIVPRGQPFLGTHGAAFRYHLANGTFPSAALTNNSDPLLGAGTVTALRIYNVHGSDGLLEMLVSF